MRILDVLLGFTLIYVCLVNTTEGCCCRFGNWFASGCNWVGCNCQKLDRGYCRVFFPLNRSFQYDSSDYCYDKKRKRATRGQRLWNTMDSNEDGVVSFEEVLAFANQKMQGNVDPQHMKDWAKQQWELMDKNQDGSVSHQEIQTYLG